VEGSPQSAAHTGTQTDDYKNHILGPNYSMQGNILLGQIVLDSMEARFLNAEGSLACKLMAALQGAKRVGADSRCTDNGTSSLFAFVKVAQPSDEFGSPSFLLSVRTHDNAGIEPIDSLQILFDEEVDCSDPATSINSINQDKLKVYPNPCADYVKIDFQNEIPLKRKVLIRNIFGNIVFEGEFIHRFTVDMKPFPSGIYFISIEENGKIFNKRILKSSNL